LSDLLSIDVVLQQCV